MFVFHINTFLNLAKLFFFFLPVALSSILLLFNRVRNTAFISFGCSAFCGPWFPLSHPEVPSAPHTELCFQPAPSHCAASVGLSPYRCCTQAGWLGREAIISWRLHCLLTPFARPQCPWCPEARVPPWLLPSTRCCFQWGLIALDAVALADPVSHFHCPLFCPAFLTAFLKGILLLEN